MMRALLPLLLLIAALPGCQRPPMTLPTIFAIGAADPLADVSAEDQNPRQAVFFATDRVFEPDGVGRDDYGRRRSDWLDLGQVNVSFGEKDAWPRIAAGARGEPGAGREAPRIVSIERFGDLYTTRFAIDEQTGRPMRVSTRNGAADRFIGGLSAALDRSSGKEITIYIHGFKNGFREAALTTAEYDLYTGGLGPFILYSWPSYNSLWEYSHDRDSVHYTTPHARNFVRFLADEIDAGHLDAKAINFICHSSGAEVIGAVLRELSLLSDDLTPEQRRERWRIGSVVMVAPDVSTDVARERVLKEDLRGMYEQIAVYSSTKDKALHWASRMLYRTPRIGAIRESDLSPADRFWLQLSPNVMLIDIDSQPSNDLVHHSHHRFSAATASDIILCLRAGLPPGERGLVRDKDAVIWRFADNYEELVAEAARRAYAPDASHADREPHP